MNALQLSHLYQYNTIHSSRMTTGGKVLMLHGFVQSDKIFRQKTGGFRKAMKKLGYELYYPCGPEVVDKSALHGNGSQSVASTYNTTADIQSEDLYGWFIRKGNVENEQKENVFEYTIPQKTFDYLHDYILENGPFDGIIGFSQGGGLGGYLATNINSICNLTMEEQPPLKFFVSFSGFRLEPSQYQKAYDDNKAQMENCVPSLHIKGELDAVVSEERVMKLYNSWPEERRTFLVHPGSHFVPNSKAFVSQVCNWIIHIDGNGNPATTTTASKQVNTINTATKKENASPQDTKPKVHTLDDDLMEMMNSIGKL